MSDRDDLVRRTEKEVRRRLATQGAGHGFDHIQRVLAMAQRIQAVVGGDLLVIELAALLHDLGDAKFHNGLEKSGELAREVLGQLGASELTIEHVVAIVDNISFRKRHDAAPLSLEGQVVQDADRLDALGAVGIVRTVEYGAALGQPFYAPESPDARTGIGHFHEKLFKLPGLMNTELGRQLAEERTRFMREFLHQFLSECGREAAT